jgi:VWFA-related protein
LQIAHDHLRSLVGLRGRDPLEQYQPVSGLNVAQGITSNAGTDPAFLVMELAIRIPKVKKTFLHSNLKIQVYNHPDDFLYEPKCCRTTSKLVEGGESMAKKLFALAFAISLQWATGASLSAQTGVETRSVPAKQGDTLVINNDRGSVRIRSAKSTTMEVRIQKRTRNTIQAAPLKVDFQRNADTISFRSIFSGFPGETVDFDIQTPDFINVKIAGANPNIDIGGIHGSVRLETRAGMILTEDLTSSVSLTTEKGDVVYRANRQPEGDVRIESTSGNIYFELGEHLNLRGQFHAGGTITWNREPAIGTKSLEKQMGTEGPLLYAGSAQGNVEVRFTELQQVIGAVATKHPDVEPDIPGKNPKKAPESSKPAEAPPVSGQEAKGGAQPPSPSPGGYSLKVNVDSVSLNVAVLDRDTGRSMGQLQREDFLVYEDGILQQIDEAAQSETPFNLLLLLDVSGSTQSYLPMMKQAAIDFTRQIKTNDRVAIATFNSSVQLVQGFTNDRAAAARAIQMIQAGGGTAFYDALMACIDQYMRDVEGRSAIVVFTDGVDNQLYGQQAAGSFVRFDELYRRIQEIEPIIYTIFLDTEGMVPTTAGGTGPAATGAIIDILGDIIRGGKPPGSNPPTSPAPAPNPLPLPRGPSDPAERAAYAEAMKQLLMIAEQTGGRFYSPRKIEELSWVYSQIADDLRIQYRLSYSSSNHKYDGRWREIRVQVKNHPRAVVRTRKGYYARKQSLPGAPD